MTTCESSIVEMDQETVQANPMPELTPQENVPQMDTPVCFNYIYIADSKVSCDFTDKEKLFIG